MIDEGQGGVDGNSNLQHFFATLRIRDEGWSLVRVVEDDPHEVVQEQGSLELLQGKCGVRRRRWTVASQLQDPQEKERSQGLLHESWSRPMSSLLMGDKAVDSADILRAVHLVPLQPEALVRGSQLEAVPLVQRPTGHQAESEGPSTSSTVS